MTAPDLRAFHVGMVVYSLTLTAGLILAVACGGSGTTSSTSANPTASAKAAPGPPPRVISVEATDSAINMPETIEGGWVTLELKNAGRTPHMIQLRKATSVQDAERLLGLERDPTVTRTALDAAAVQSGGVPPLPPGASSQVTLNLAPGVYNVADNVPAEGVPNYRKGLARTLTVTASSGPAAQEPVATATLAMKDNSYGTFPGLAAGQSTIKFLNDGPETHTAIIARLAEGKTASDAFQSFVANVRTGVVTNIGGLEGEAKGQTAYATITLTAGDYVFFCGLPDPASGKTHAQLGMVTGFTVK